MWTNIFRIGDLQVVSWFQLLPCESDISSLSEKSLKVAQKDAATHMVLSAHLRLQQEGFLSSWTNSFVGPWDPSQGVHNPDERVKLWLFLPGRHSSIIETAQAAVSKLRVVGNGIWLAPGDSEEVAVALSQALRNSIERALKGLSYIRFGDAFTRCHSYTQSERNYRRAQPTFEFVFAATEEAIYVHAVISAKHIRGLCSDDMERVLRHRTSSSNWEGLPVIVAPNGMQGRLTGCCPSDLVKQVYMSEHRAPNGLSVGNPFHSPRSSGCKLRGQSCYAEVTLGCSSAHSDKSLESNGNNNKDTIHPDTEEPQMSFGMTQQKQGLTERFPILERSFFHAAETVLVPLMHRAFASSSLKRFWLQNAVGTSPFELWPLWNLSASSHIEHCFDSMEGLVFEVDGMRQQARYNSSSNSNSSSISSISSTSGESDLATSFGGDDFDADADSLTCRQSGLSSNDQFENDGHKKVSKRPRASTTETYGPEGTVINADIQDPYKSENCGVANSNTAGATNIQVNPHWDWDDEDRSMGDIQILLSEFGEFGDFFEDDDLEFGEPPGTAESQVIMHPTADSEDVSCSPCTVGMDMSDQKFSPVGFPSFEAFNQSFGALTEDARSANMEITQDARPSVVGSHSSIPSAGKFEYLTKAEAMMTFAPEYASVEIPASEFSMSIFRTPYLPSARRPECSDWSSSAYVYSAAPPSRVVEVSEGKTEICAKLNSRATFHDVSSSVKVAKLYTQVHGKMEKPDRQLFNDDSTLFKGDISSSMFGQHSSNTAISLSKQNNITYEAAHFLLSLKPALATEIECFMFQAAMCRIRHTLLSFSNKIPSGLRNISGSPMQSLVSGATSTVPEMLFNKYLVKKKDMVPVRIAGDVDGGMVDGPITAQVGVWRSVGNPKGARSLNSRTYENPSSLPPNTLVDEDLDANGQRMSLQELLDAMALLVQQSTSFVDLSLDTEDGNGCYSWLALQEQRRRGFSCGPFMVHAGCGGLLATCHYVDIAGVDLIDPLSAEVQVSSATSLLHSDIKVALKAAFGNLDGPLSVIDWCKGRNQSGDSVAIADAYSFQCTVGEAKDSTINLVGEPISPPQSSGGSSGTREGARIDESAQRRLNQELCIAESEQGKSHPRFRPTLLVLPLPAILVGYQDDWLKTSANCLQLWEKAPLEPYAQPKPVNYYALCPDIDLLSFAAADFFQQLGTVYEACKLGSHSPQMIGGQVEIFSGKCLPSGLVLVDCPDQLKVAGNNIRSISSTSDFLQALSKGWNVKSYVKNLTKVIKDLKIVSTSSVNQKEISTGPSTVVYVVCPFPEPTAVLETLVECSAALGSVFLSPEKERRSLLYSQVAKALKCTPAVDETAASNVLTLSGFNVPKLVMQIVTVESLLRINKPVSELAILKDIAFTVYSKVRRFPRAASTVDLLQSSTLSGRSQSTLMHSTSVPGLWKDCLTPRISGSALTRENELDASLRTGTWDNSWQTSRPGGLNGDPNRPIEVSCQDEVRYTFEPLFVLAEPGSVEHGISPAVFGSSALDSSSSKSFSDDNSGIYMQNSTSGGSTDIGMASLIDGPEHEHRTSSLHCSYGWTEDWRWLVCIWTDSRGELLDSNIFPFGGISSRQDTKVLHNLFVQVLYQGCQILSCASSDSGVVRPRGIVITRIGCFFELECQEWQKAIYSVGGNEVKKWPLQLRRSLPDGLPSSANGTSLQQQDMGLIQERNLPSSPSPPFYGSHTKSSFMKGGLGQTNSKKQLLPGHSGMGSTRGLLNLVQSISLIGVSIDHSLHLILPADMSSGGGTQSSSSSGVSSYLEGFSPVKSLASTPASYLLIPSPSLRYLPPTPMQLPTCLTSESPPLAHLLHSKGSAIPLATGYVVSKAVPAMKKDLADATKEDWPSILAVSLVDHYGSHNMVRGAGANKQRSLGTETTSSQEVERRLVLESVAAELHSLSWMTVSPVYPERRTALPFHCDMLLRLRRLLHYADKVLTRPPENVQQ